ncbi:MAG: hypothetical protein KAJ53_10180 [Anaerolineales bacterium]|nr:hypothetical protein [Anaerolineales bacterium]
MRKELVILALILITVLSTACSGNQTGDPILPDHNDIDPVFREFYDLLGGYETLGPPISPLFVTGNVKYQYTVASLMVHDPQAPANQRFHLGALGQDMGITEPPVPRPDEPDVRYVDGHIIDEAFIPIYESLGGARYVGSPLTEMHYNPENGRYEQHFENLGMFWLDRESKEDVRLLAYGAWKCNASCRQMPLGDSNVILPPRIDDAFVDAVARLGPNFTGFALTDGYQTKDGYIEQVFENIVLVSDPNQSSRVFLRPITVNLGFRPDPIMEPKNDPGLTFFPKEGGKGYNVPNHFLDYLAHHGGMEAAGEPIGELVRMKDNVYSLCFRNLCLEEHYSPSGALTIKPAQLGYTYKLLPVPLIENESEILHGLGGQPQSESEAEVYPPPETINQPEVQPTPPSHSRELSIQVWETYPSVTPNQSQEIGVSVFENGVPLSKVEPDLVLTLPEGKKITYYMHPTGDNGQARVRLNPIDAPNGTLIPYEVCVYNLMTKGKFCIRDSFLIWENPP